MSKKSKVNRTVRFDSNDLADAKTLDIDVNEISRKALSIEINFRMSPDYKKMKRDRKKLQKAG